MNIYAQENPWLSYDITDQVDQYLNACKARRLSERTISTYSFYLDWLKKWAEEIGANDVRRFDAQLLRSYLQWAQLPGARGKRSPYTLHGAFRVMRSFFQHLANEEVIEVSPVAKIREPKLPKQILPALTETEIKSIIGYWSEWEKKPRHERTGLDLFSLRNLALFYFLLDTGLRVEEASRVLLADVDLKSGRVFVRCGKGEKDRITFLSAHSLKYLGMYLRIVPASEIPQSKQFRIIFKNSAFSKTSSQGYKNGEYFLTRSNGDARIRELRQVFNELLRLGYLEKESSLMEWSIRDRISLNNPLKRYISVDAYVETAKKGETLFRTKTQTRFSRLGAEVTIAVAKTNEKKYEVWSYTHQNDDSAIIIWKLSIEPFWSLHDIAARRSAVPIPGSLSTDALGIERAAFRFSTGYVGEAALYRNLILGNPYFAEIWRSKYTLEKIPESEWGKIGWRQRLGSAHTTLDWSYW